MEKQTSLTRKISIGLTIGLIILVTAVAFAVTSRNDDIPSPRSPEKAELPWIPIKKIYLKLS